MGYDQTIEIDSLGGTNVARNVWTKVARRMG